MRAPPPVTPCSGNTDSTTAGVRKWNRIGKSARSFPFIVANSGVASGAWLGVTHTASVRSSITARTGPTVPNLHPRCVSSWNGPPETVTIVPPAAGAPLGDAKSNAGSFRTRSTRFEFVMSTRFRDTSSARSSSSANALVSHKASALLMNTPGSMDVAPMEQNVPTRSAVSPISAARKKFFPLTKTISPPRVEATSGSMSVTNARAWKWNWNPNWVIFGTLPAMISYAAKPAGMGGVMHISLNLFTMIPGDCVVWNLHVVCGS
jgi:hypothetical protein